MIPLADIASPAYCKVQFVTFNKPAYYCIYGNKCLEVT